MVTLTEDAINEIKKVITERNLPSDTALRVGIKGGGCAGFSYILDFVSEAGKLDVVFDGSEIKVIVDRKSLLYIAGTEIDFNNNLTDRGFKFNNPKSDNTCGCGTSFSPKIKSFA